VLLAEADEKGTRAFLDRIARSGPAVRTRETHRSFDPAEPDGVAILAWVRERLEATGHLPLQLASNG